PNLLKTAAISEALDHNTSFKDLANFFKGFYQKHLAAPQASNPNRKSLSAPTASTHTTELPQFLSAKPSIMAQF
ncbi:hypothetical protein K3217_28060, partial [bacterium BD-1]|nr:hypothetical protein [Ottowia caeni]